MPKKGENVYKRKDGRWEGRYIRSRNRGGTAVYGYVYGKTYKEVKEKLLKRKVFPPQHPEKQQAQITYGQLLDDWLCSSKLRVKASTYARYVHLVQTHIRPGLGDWRLSRLTTKTIEDFIASQLKSGRLDGRGGLAPKTVTDILTIIKRTIEYAKYNHYSVSCDLKTLSVKKHDKEMRVLTPEEQTALLRTLMNDMDPCKFGVILSLYTGIRIGELCALLWEDLRLPESTLRIRRTMQRIQVPETDAIRKTKIVITATNSDNSQNHYKPNGVVVHTAKRSAAEEYMRQYSGVQVVFDYEG